MVAQVEVKTSSSFGFGTENFYFRFSIWSDFQAKELNIRGELEHAANQAESENQAEPRGTHLSRFRSRFFENIKFEVLAATYQTWSTDAEYVLTFLIWGFWKPQEAFQICPLRFCHPKESPPARKFQESLPGLPEQEGQAD